MLMEHEIKKLLNELVQDEVARIDLDGSRIVLKSFDSGDKLFLSTPVYSGGNYIPKSVRNCLNKSAPFDDRIIKTSLKVDEDNFQIYLNYLGKIDGMNEGMLVHVLEGFSGLAAKWRDYLDEHDRNDLVRVPVK